LIIGNFFINLFIILVIAKKNFGQAILFFKGKKKVTTK